MTKFTKVLKVLVAATALTAAIASPSLAQRVPQQQDGGGTYRGYPLNEWHTQDSW
jgi:hypothetical protein